MTRFEPLNYWGNEAIRLSKKLKEAQQELAYYKLKERLREDKTK